MDRNRSDQISKMPNAGLSSTALHQQLKASQYQECFGSVQQHLRGHPQDEGSAAKFINALAYHVYYTPNLFKEDPKQQPNIDDLLSSSLSLAFGILASGSGSKDESRVKIVSSGHILVRALLTRNGSRWNLSKSQLLSSCLQSLKDFLNPEDEQQHVQCLDAMAKLIHVLGECRTFKPNTDRELRALFMVCRVGLGLRPFCLPSEIDD